MFSPSENFIVLNGNYNSKDEEINADGGKSIKFHVGIKND